MITADQGTGLRLRLQFLSVLFLFGLFGACTPAVPLPAPDAYPQNLSEWNLIWREVDALKMHPEAMVYDLNTPLFSDYALKLRAVYLPAGNAALYQENEVFDFPVGTVISKTFFYAKSPDGALTKQTNWDGDARKVTFSSHHIMETRLLVRQPHGWDALPYIWNGDDAHLAISGKLIPASLDEEKFVYQVPSRNECAGCHVTDHTAKALLPIGLKARLLNRPAPTLAENQLSRMASKGQLYDLPDDLSHVPKAASHTEKAEPLADRARAYLDANCGHCHNPKGAADTSGLWLDAHTTDTRQMGQCKAPIAAGRGTGGRLFSVVPGRPDESILLWRMETSDPATRMPEVGRSLVHDEGVELIRAWIESLPGAC
ncbi:MAG: hypothetical protein FJ194_16785 [Gammaproteobacteria bacterium]|nr:hypothetical protein [Gammaproteobacteria bacterium]